MQLYSVKTANLICYFDSQIIEIYNANSLNILRLLFYPVRERGRRGRERGGKERWREKEREIMFSEEENEQTAINA